MTTMREELQIDCPPETVFDLMADVRNSVHWNTGVSSSELKGGGPVGLGSRFTTVGRGQTFETEVAQYARPGDLRLRTSTKIMDVDGTFDFSHSDGGTRLVMEFDAQPNGVMKLFFPIVLPMIKRDVMKQHLRFKAHCERVAHETT
jgi:carbon monoxide dehydrogenase subunit G